MKLDLLGQCHRRKWSTGLFPLLSWRHGQIHWLSAWIDDRHSQNLPARAPLVGGCFGSCRLMHVNIHCFAVRWVACCIAPMSISFTILSFGNIRRLFVCSAYLVRMLLLSENDVNMSYWGFTLLSLSLPLTEICSTLYRIHGAVQTVIYCGLWKQTPKRDHIYIYIYI